MIFLGSILYLIESDLQSQFFTIWANININEIEVCHIIRRVVTFFPPAYSISLTELCKISLNISHVNFSVLFDVFFFTVLQEQFQRWNCWTRLFAFLPHKSYFYTFELLLYRCCDADVTKFETRSVTFHQNPSSFSLPSHFPIYLFPFSVSLFVFRQLFPSLFSRSNTLCVVITWNFISTRFKIVQLIRRRRSRRVCATSCHEIDWTKKTRKKCQNSFWFQKLKVCSPGNYVIFLRRWKIRKWKTRGKILVIFRVILSKYANYFHRYHLLCTRNP